MVWDLLYRVSSAEECHGNGVADNTFNLKGQSG
jgi:hypothetical protein